MSEKTDLFRNQERKQKTERLKKEQEELTRELETKGLVSQELEEQRDKIFNRELETKGLVSQELEEQRDHEFNNSDSGMKLHNVRGKSIDKSRILQTPESLLKDIRSVINGEQGAHVPEEEKKIKDRINYTEDFNSRTILLQKEEGEIRGERLTGEEERDCAARTIMELHRELRDNPLVKEYLYYSTQGKEYKEIIKRAIEDNEYYEDKGYKVAIGIPGYFEAVKVNIDILEDIYHLSNYWKGVLLEELDKVMIPLISERKGVLKDEDNERVVKAFRKIFSPGPKVRFMELGDSLMTPYRNRTLEQNKRDLLEAFQDASELRELIVRELSNI